jgi:hypothetical protein
MSTLSYPQLPHKFQYIVAILIHSYFESPNIILHYSEKIAVGQKYFFFGDHGHVCIDTFFFKFVTKCEYILLIIHGLLCTDECNKWETI